MILLRIAFRAKLFKKKLKNSVKTLYFFSEIKYNTNIKPL